MFFYKLIQRFKGYGLTRTQEAAITKYVINFIHIFLFKSSLANFEHIT